MTWPSRSTATTVQSRGRGSSIRSRPTDGDSSVRVASDSRARPPSKESRRTRVPTDTASSTRAVSRCGVDTETSTPQVSVNIHSLRGLLTRATTRGTANSCLASSEITRLSSSSPVTAATTSARSTSALASSDTSQASATTQRTPGEVSTSSATAARARSTSTTVTSWPALARSVAMKVPTLPPPAITILMV